MNRFKLRQSSLASLFCLAALAASPAAGEILGYHDVRTDSQGKIVAWESYDLVVRSLWDFWRGMKPCPNGVSYYLQHQVWKPEEDPRGIGGDQIPMAMSSWELLYGYLGDAALIADMRHMADYWLSHGMSKPGDQYAN